jgi:uncharacterized protein YnzC (UPF0291/DUF896 family)
MSPDLSPQGGVRSAEEINENIRDLARAAWGRPFTDDERARYQRLRDEWVAAVRAKVMRAA